MVKCQECGYEGAARDVNNKGPRCILCGSLEVVPIESPAVEPASPKRTIK